MFYTYVLIGKNKNYYIGSTNNLSKRLLEHEKGLVESTSKYKPLKLVYYEACLSLKGARLRERQLKSGYGRAYLSRRLKSANSSVG